MWICAYEPICPQKPEGDEPAELELQVVVRYHTWLLESSLYPLQKQYALLTTESFLQPFISLF